MSYDRFKHQRRSIRWKGYDCTQVGPYFITICLQGGRCLLGEVVDGSMQPNAAVAMIQEEWLALTDRFPAVALDACVIMPNHIHGIILIHNPPHHPDPDQPVGAPLVGVLDTDSRAGTRPAPTCDQSRRPSLGQVVGVFKSISTVKYTRGVKEHQWEAFHKRLWQRNYYEHVIRNERALQAIRRYIANNAAAWREDALHPQHPKRHNFWN